MMVMGINSRGTKLKQNSIQCFFLCVENSAAAMAMDMDSFSKLPEDIIHHIMSFLPTTIDAMALSAVSKTFSSAFRRFPILDFNLDHHTAFSDSEITKFMSLESAVNYIQRRLICLDKLRLVARGHAYPYITSTSTRIIDNLFRSAIDHSKLKELELDFGNRISQQADHQTEPKYYLPPALFSSKTIKVLTLKGLAASHDYLIISIPSLENLCLINCRSLIIEFGASSSSSNRKLKQLKIENCKEIHVEAPTPCLEYLWCDFSLHHCKLDITCSTCPKLKHLEYYNQGTFLEPWIEVQYNFSQFRFLETLKLKVRCGFNEIKFGHLESLKALELEFIYFMKFEIEAPNLVSLTCKTESVVPPVINIGSSSTNLKHLQFHGENIPQPWVAQNFSEFHFLETLKLIGSRGLKKIKFHLEYLNALELYHADFLKVEIEAPNLFSLIYKSRISRPAEINISSSSTNLKHLKFKGEFLPRRWVAEDFSEFRFLETLKLTTHCYQFPLNKVKFQLQRLKVLKLVIPYCWELFTVEIEAPNLVSFIYMKKNIIAQNSVTSFAPLVTFTSKAKPNFNLDLSSRPHENHFRNLKNFHDYRKNMAFPWKNLKHLKVESRYSHPNTLSFIVDSKVNSLKFYYKNENNVESWQLDLKKVVDKFEEGNKRIINYFRKLWKRN